MKNLYKVRDFTCKGCHNSFSKRRPELNTKYCSLQCYRNSKKKIDQNAPKQLEFFGEKE